METDYMKNLMDIIKGRKSVRSFDGCAVPEDKLELLCGYAESITNPFHISVNFVFLDTESTGLSSPVITGEKYYVTGIVEKRPYADVAFGYAFEQLVLYAWSLGIGTTWIGGTMKREQFEKASGLQEWEMMPCVSPLGYPAKKKSFKETLMRKGISADSRMPAEKFFFENVWNIPAVTERTSASDNSAPDTSKDASGELIEMVRWAPSAVNKQPWRIIRQEGAYHFYEKKDKGFIGDATGDLQKIDVGIALCHFVMGAEEKGLKPEVMISNPEIEVPDGVEYIATVKLMPLINS